MLISHDNFDAVKHFHMDDANTTFIDLSYLI